MNGYEKRTQAKKEAILNVARELFTKRGIADVKISEIAAKANVSQAFSISSKVVVSPSSFIRFKSKKSFSTTLFIIELTLIFISSSSKPQNIYPFDISFFFISPSSISILINVYCHS